jgi:lipoprotein NlpI
LVDWQNRLRRFCGFALRFRPAKGATFAGLLLAILGALHTAGSFAASETPLFDFARELPFVSVVAESTALLEATQYEIAHNPPPQEECSRKLGANRFAEMYERLGSIQASIGDSAAAMDSLTKSLGCNPRVAHVHASLASRLMELGHLEEAREEAGRARAIDAEDETAALIVVQLDLIEERWNDAIAELRALIARTVSPGRATSWEIFLWIAQRRSGDLNPRDSATELTDDWPRPALEFLRGALTEEDVLRIVEDEGDDRRQREKLTEALYYAGQARLADGDTDNARLYFTAAVNLKVMYFIEHRLALAELEKMRARSP